MSLVAKVSEIKAPDKILKRNKMSYVTKQDCTIGDSTSACKLVLWEKRIGADHVYVVCLVVTSVIESVVGLRAVGHLGRSVQFDEQLSQ